MSKEYTPVKILRLAVLCLMLVPAAGRAAASQLESVLPFREPPALTPGIPPSRPDIAPLPPGISSPAYDAIRQRCAIALEQRSCIEAAARDATGRPLRHNPQRH